MFRNILSGSRYLVMIAVIGTFVSSLVVLIYGLLTVVNIVIDAFSHNAFTTTGAKHLAVGCIEMIDLFLLGTILYIIALGLYELFIDESLPTPHWLVIVSLDNLKEKLLGVVVVLLAVTFLGDVVTWDGSNSILALGVAVGLVLFALGYLLGIGFNIRRVTNPHESKEEIKNE